jgi:hypothetical protein
MGSKDNSSPPGSRFESQSGQSLRGIRNLLDKITPTLFDIGSWVLGGLIALNLVVIGALIPVGGVDASILISAAAMASALPLNIAGILLLRLSRDMEGIRIDELARQAFQEAEFPEIEAYFPADQDSAALFKRSSNVTRLYSLGIIVLISTTLTLTGLVTVLWHLAWWLGVLLLAMVILSAILTIVILARSMPPESDREKELKKLAREKLEKEKLR